MRLTGKQIQDFIQDELLVVVVFFCAYILVYFASKKYGLVNSYQPGISLFFLPAGVRLIAALTGRLWGVLGVSLAIWLVIPSVWIGQSDPFYFAYAFIGGLSTFGGVVVSQKLLGVHANLDNLNFIHLPIIDLIATMTHACALNLFLLHTGLIDTTELQSRLLSQMTGNFLGGMVFMLGLMVILNLGKKLTLIK